MFDLLQNKPSTTNHQEKEKEKEKKQEHDFERAYYIAIILGVLIHKRQQQKMPVSVAEMKNFRELLQSITEVNNRLHDIIDIFENKRTILDIIPKEYVRLDMQIVNAIRYGNYKAEVGWIIAALLLDSKEVLELYSGIDAIEKGKNKTKGKTFIAHGLKIIRTGVYANQDRKLTEIGKQFDAYLKRGNTDKSYQQIWDAICFNTFSLIIALSVFWLEDMDKVEKDTEREKNKNSLEMGSFF